MRSSSELAGTFARDGVVLVEGGIAPSWLQRLDRVVDSALEAPSRWASDSGERPDGGRIFEERYLWRATDDVRRFALESGVAALVGEALGCERARFYFDHWFVKEPGADTGTPWHQDAPYWPFRGREIASAWVPLTDVTPESSGLELVKGSHRWDKRFRPRRFVASDPTDDWVAQADDAEDVPDIDAHRDDYEIFSEPMRRGDVLLFSAWTLHAAPANHAATRRVAMSTRWLGDDVLFWPHPGSDPTVRAEDVSVGPGEPATDDDRFPVGWSRSR